LLAQNSSAVGFRAEYRLVLVVDDCADAPPTPPNAWPGLRGHADSEPPPILRKRFELRLSRDATRVPNGPQVDLVEAACVPDSGHGPTCQLRGSVAVLSDGMLTVNGRPSPRGSRD
jgi:hypothetical protein